MADAGRGAQRGSPFRATYFADIPAEHHKEWVIDDVLGAGEITAWYGYPGSGKSAVAADAAAHVAAGLPWFDRPVARSGVIYVAAERAGLVRRRLRAWGKHHSIDDLPLAVVDGAIDLSNPEHEAELIRIGRGLTERFAVPVGLLVIDTKARVMGGGDPNSDVDVMALVASIARIQSALGGPHVIVVDHVPYSSPERIKGSGALPGAIDGSFLVRNEGGTHTITIGSKPPNDGPDDLSLSFTLRSVDIGIDAKGKVTTAPVVIPDDEPAGPSAVRLSPAGQKVLAAFWRLVEQGPTYTAPAAPGVRAATRAVALADLQAMAFTLGIYPHPEPADPAEHAKWLAGRRQAWKRGIEAVTDPNAKALRGEGNFVWDPSSGWSVTD
jgi:hypothetical protein